MIRHLRSSAIDILGIALVVSAFIFCLAGLSRLQSNGEDVLQWLPDNSPSRQTYENFKDKFGSDDFMVVTWPDCTIDDPRLQQFCRQVVDNDPDKLVQSVTNGTTVLKRLGSTVELQKKHVLNRFKGIFYGLQAPDQTLALIELTPTGTAQRRQALQQVETAIIQTPGLELDQTIFGGYPYLGVNIDKQLNSSIVYYFVPSILLASIVSFYCLRNVWLCAIIFFAGITAAACSIAIVPLFGAKFGGLMSIIPALVYILTVSGSIHLIHYSLEAIGNPTKLISISWKPCTISAVTTAIGMLSLSRSAFPAIRNFGFFCATGVCFALVFQLIVVPWLLHRFGASGQNKLASRSSDHRSWNRLTNFVHRQRFGLAWASIGVMVLCALGLSRLTAQVQVRKLFDEDSAIISSLTNLEARMGPIDQSELLIEFQEVDAKNFHARAKLVYEIQRSLPAIKDIGSTHSLHNYLPREPTGTRVRSRFKRQAYQSQLDAQREQLAQTRFLNVSHDSETWRISLRSPFADDGNVEHLKSQTLDQASAAIEKMMDTGEFDVIVAPIVLDYTGKNYLFNSAQMTLLKDFYGNFVLAFAIITPVLIVVLRSPRLGLLAILPNLFPIVAFFGVLGWLGWPVDLAISMTACVALGIAVDDTTHFLIRFGEFQADGSNVDAAIGSTISQCGAAMLKTTLIGCGGLFVYGFCDMVVVRNFAIAISSMLVLALIADIFMLPALLYLWASKPVENTNVVDIVTKEKPPLMPTP